MIGGNDILLESGTNEMELMEFTIAGQAFGINIAKVREIMKCMPVKPMQNAHELIKGIFKPRDQVITVLSLDKYLSLPESRFPERDIFMITEFNGQTIAFHVHSVVGIDRVSWKDIQKPDQIIYGGEEGVATGIVEYDNRLITILDFEKIIAELSSGSSIRVDDVRHMGVRAKKETPILLAEDSALLGKLIADSLRAAGYTNIIKLDNGQEAYDYLTELKNGGAIVDREVALIISDIEMPQMDGHRFLKLVKEDATLRQIPFVLFSSLINDEMRVKGEQLGADAQLSKPQIVNLISTVDMLLKKVGKGA
ncbi:MAG: chemotaxis protein [Clostridiales bacterium]|jgi:two-component system chemotaxis response regulator CheV|nr:chemotaxis protein [Clostridiales bacterium]